MFTSQEIEEIRRKLQKFSKKDSQLDVVDTVTLTDRVAVLQNLGDSYKNVTISLKDFSKVLGTKGLTLKEGENITLTENPDGSITISAKDTIYTLPKATTEALGGIKLGYTQSGKNYPVSLDSEGRAYVNVPWTGGSGGSGTVSSVGIQVPTGFEISGSPITDSGTINISFASGYSLPTNVKQTNWDKAFNWGNHAEVGYLKSLPTASSDILGGIKVGAGLRIEQGVLSTEEAQQADYIIYKIPITSSNLPPNYTKGGTISLGWTLEEYNQFFKDVQSGKKVMAYLSHLEVDNHASLLPISIDGTTDDSILEFTFFWRDQIFQVSTKGLNQYQGLLIENIVDINPLLHKLTGLTTTPTSGVFEGGQEYLGTDTLLQFLNKLINNTQYDAYRVFHSGTAIAFMFESAPNLTVIRFSITDSTSRLVTYSRKDNRKVRDYLGKDYAFLFQELGGGNGWTTTVNLDLLSLGKTYELPKATSSILGGVKVPTTGGLNVDNQGNLTVKTSTNSTVRPDSNGNLQGFPGDSTITLINKLSGGSFTLNGGEFIVFDKSGSTTQDTITINGADSSWSLKPESFISIEENPQPEASIVFKGINLEFMGGISTTVTNLGSYSGFIVKRFKKDSSNYSVVIIPIARAITA